MKYIDADRLRARIEKYLTFDNSIDTAFYIGRRDAERSILALIDSLRQEQPEVDLENEIDEKWDEFVSSEGEREDFTRIARYFYNLGLNARKEE